MTSPAEFGSLLFASPSRERRAEETGARSRSPRYAARLSGPSPTRETSWRRVSPADVTSPPPTQTLADRLRRPSETRIRGQDVDKPSEEEQPSSATTLDTWVTVYGFQPSEAALVMRTFQTMGEVVDFGRYGPARSNWMHIRYRTRQGAQRALTQDGKQIAEGLLVGVKPLDEEEAQRIVSERGEGGGNVRFAPQVPSTLSRPYRIDGDPKADGLPRPVHSTWEKITECIFGL